MLTLNIKYLFLTDEHYLIIQWWNEYGVSDVETILVWLSVSNNQIKPNNVRMQNFKWDNRNETNQIPIFEFIYTRYIYSPI